MVILGQFLSRVCLQVKADLFFCQNDCDSRSRVESSQEDEVCNEYRVAKPVYLYLTMSQFS